MNEFLHPTAFLGHFVAPGAGPVIGRVAGPGGSLKRLSTVGQHSCGSCPIHDKIQLEDPGAVAAFGGGQISKTSVSFFFSVNANGLPAMKPRSSVSWPFRPLGRPASRPS
jgi:hypothetical protein